MNAGILDNPTWQALRTRQAHLRWGDGLACRYLPEVSPFAALADHSDAAMAALAKLLPASESVLLQTLRTLPHANSLCAEPLGDIHQMLATQLSDAHDDSNVVRLDTGDVPSMIQLARRTQPGPFARRTIEMGEYLGIYDRDRLIAMAGERMQCDGFVEISAVCVDEAYRGMGLAARLMTLLHRRIKQRGDTPFLHVFDHNRRAIAVYERLGFVTRRRFQLYRISRTPM